MSDLPAPPDGARRIVYLGTPDLAVAPLRALVAAGYDVPLVLSAPDVRRGRGGRTMPSPVKAAATDLGLAVTDRPADLLGAGADLGVVVAYGRLIKLDLLTALPFVNLHFSLLPRWRGAAPVERAILAGDERTGVCLMAVEETLDTGGVYRRRSTDVDDKTLDDLRGELVDDGIDLLLEALRDGFGPPEPQTGEATYAAKVDPSERCLNFRQPAVAVARTVRIGGAWTTFRDTRLKVHAAVVVPAAAGSPGELDGTVVACGDGHGLELVEVQPEGRGRMPATAWRNGAQPGSGERLGE